MANKGRIDVMVDLETLGTGLDALVFQIASVAFDIKTGEVGNTFNFNLTADISKTQVIDGVIEGATLKWWLETDVALFKKLTSKGAISPAELIKSYHGWLSWLVDCYDEVYLWGNGILFDNAIIRHKFESRGLDYPIRYKNDRDVRTIAELARAVTGESEQELRDRVYDKSLTAHDALNDVINQVRLVSECYRILTIQGSD